MTSTRTRARPGQIPVEILEDPCLKEDMKIVCLMSIFFARALNYTSNFSCLQTTVSRYQKLSGRYELLDARKVMCAANTADALHGCYTVSVWFGKDKGEREERRKKTSKTVRLVSKLQ